MLELIEQGTPNIVCTQPFGCLPNHIVGKGMIRVIKRRNPQANIVAVDYDPGATKINQENRIKLMLANAQRQTMNSEPPETEPALPWLRADERYDLGDGILSENEISAGFHGEESRIS